jgi:hypothetical protein
MNKLSGAPANAVQAKIPGNRPFIQPKLSVNRPNDPYERQADAMANHVMNVSMSRQSPFFPPKPTAPAVQLKCAACAATEQEEEGSVMREAEAGAGTPVSSSLAAGLSSTKGGGAPLSGGARQFMETAFGADFSSVRIHADGSAADMSRSIQAKAFTHGNDIYFNSGQYQPDSPHGQHLLAHELTHVLQQGGSEGAGLIQRAETDDRSCAGLTDIKTIINTEVNSQIAAARTAAGTPIMTSLLLREVNSRLGNGAISPIEDFIVALPATQRRLPGRSLSGTKYSGADSVNRVYLLHTLGAANVVGSNALVNGICIGADKLGHFFNEGFVYFRVAHTAGRTSADAEATGGFLEIDLQGLGSTGVFSNADRAANRAGMQFYEDLNANPSGLVFDVANYITTQWNEQTNPSFYEASLAGVVWSNLLTGRWTGPFTSARGTSTPTDSIVSMTVTPAGNVTGTYKWPAGATSPNTGTFTGTITQRTTSVTGANPRTSPPTPVAANPVSGISIDFDWREGTASGKGNWTSTNEQTLVGTWGIGTSRTSGGTWNLTK